MYYCGQLCPIFTERKLRMRVTARGQSFMRPKAPCLPMLPVLCWAFLCGAGSVGGPAV